VAVYLYRLGRFAFRHRWVMLGLWLLMLVAAGVAGATLSGQTTSSFSIPGTPAQEAADLMAERAPQLSEGGTRARFVFAAPEGERIDTPEYQAAIEKTLEQLRAWPDNITDVFPDYEGDPLDANQKPAEVRDPFQTGQISPNGRVAIAEVLFAVQSPDLVAQTREFLAVAGDDSRQAGLEVEVGGDALQPPVEQGLTELVGVAVAAVVLTITFGSLIAAGLPLLMAILGIGIGISLITAATGFIDMSAESSILAMMLGLAVAIDYSLFIVSRHRVELAKGKSLEESIGIAVGTAGNAVVFAGTTVIIALAGLSVVGIPFLTTMALAAVVTVFFAILIAVSLLPAVLGFVGRMALSRKVRKGRVEPGSATTEFAPGVAWGKLITRNPLVVLLLAVIGLGVIAIPAFQMELGIPGDEVAPLDSTQRKAYDLIAANFGPGYNGPLLVVLDIPDGVDGQAAAEAVQADLQAMDGVAFVAPPNVIPDAHLGIISLTPTTAPSSAATTDLVRQIRDSADQILSDTGVSIGVTGLTAFLIDVSTRLGEALTPYLVVVVGLALILLLLVFRSIVVPLKATLGFLLTIGATFGAVVAVFQWGWLADLFGVQQIGPILSFLPIFMIGVVFGLAMDYEFFLVTRMREEYIHGAEPKQAVIHGLGFSGKVVTAAAIIMISVFMGFVIDDNPIITSIGFALAFGVLVDAFVVRLTIVPAVLALLGRGAWWIPRWLNAIVPNVDVEGERLRRHIDGAAKPSPQPAE
jgi:RND superfamily putative drug exporter